MNNRKGFFCQRRLPAAPKPHFSIKQKVGICPCTGKRQPSVFACCGPGRATLRLCIFSKLPFHSVANTFVFRAFGNSAGMLLFACAAAFKTVCTVVVFPTAFTSRAGGVVINSRILGHCLSPLLELCYSLFLAPHLPGHKRIACLIS